MSSPIVTVTAAAASRRLVDLSYARLMMGLDASADPVLDNLLDSASAAAERWCNRKLIRESVSEIWRLPQPRESLPLTRWPIVSIASVTEGTGDALDSAYYEADLEDGQLYRLDGSDCRSRWCATKVTVAYTGGYLAEDETGSDVPDDLRDGVMAIVRAAWFAQGRDPYLRSEEVPGVARFAYGFGAAAQSESGLPPEAESLLAPYRMLVVG